MGFYFPFYRYLYRHSHFRYLQHSLRYAFDDIRNAPLPRFRIRSFGYMLEPRYIFGTKLLDQ